MSFSPDLCKFTGKKYVSQLNIKTQGFPLGGSQCGAGCFSLMLRISKIPPSLKGPFCYPPTAKMLILPFLHTPVSLLLSTTTCWEGIINNFKTDFTKNFTCISYLQEHNHSFLKKLVIKCLILIQNSVQQNCVPKLSLSAPPSCQKCFYTLILLCLPSICFALVFMHAACHPENEIVGPRENQKDQ